VKDQFQLGARSVPRSPSRPAAPSEQGPPCPGPPLPATPGASPAAAPRILPGNIRVTARVRTPAFATPSPYLHWCLAWRDGRLPAPTSLPGSLPPCFQYRIRAV